MNTTTIVIIVLVILALAIGRAIVMWWIGTEEIVKNIKEMKADQKKVIELLKVIADHSAAPQLTDHRSASVIQNPLTGHRPQIQNTQGEDGNRFYRQ